MSCPKQSCADDTRIQQKVSTIHGVLSNAEGKSTCAWNYTATALGMVTRPKSVTANLQFSAVHGRDLPLPTAPTTLPFCSHWMPESAHRADAATTDASKSSTCSPRSP